MAKANILIDNDKVKVTEWFLDVGDSTGHHIHELLLTTVYSIQKRSEAVSFGARPKL